MMELPLLLFSLACIPAFINGRKPSATAFVLDGSLTSNHHHAHRTTTASRQFALTQRQMQFWEDVEAGLDDIEEFFAKKGQNIDRIRQFGKR